MRKSKPKEPKPTPGIIIPFSEDFKKTWQLWLDYKFEEFGFKYKGCISEQAALMSLTTLSNGNEETAVAIINQSISNRWRGLFALKNNPTNGQSTTKAATRESVNQEFASRDYSKRI